MFRSQSANRIDELYYKGMRLRRDAAARIGTKSGARGAQRRGGRLGDEVTSQTQAIQSIANMSWCFVLSLPTDGDGVNPVCRLGVKRKENRSLLRRADEVSEEKESLSRPRHKRVEVAHDTVERDPNAPAANGWERDIDGP